MSLNYIGIETGNQNELKSMSRIGIDKIQTIPNPSPYGPLLVMWSLHFLTLTIISKVFPLTWRWKYYIANTWAEI